MGPTERETGIATVKLDVPWANRGCPGSGIRSGGQGRRLGTGGGRGPIGSPVGNPTRRRKVASQRRVVRSTRRR